MTPDLRRLCEAAASQSVNLPVDHGSTASSDPADYEAIVRAVLMELREASPEVIEAGRWAAEDDGPDACLRAMLDHILSVRA